MRSFNNNPTGKPYCCQGECELDAVFAIEPERVDRSNWEDGTDSCEAHLGEMVKRMAGWPMVVRVFPVEGR